MELYKGYSALKNVGLYISIIPPKLAPVSAPAYFNPTSIKSIMIYHVNMCMISKNLGTLFFRLADIMASFYIQSMNFDSWRECRCIDVGAVHRYHE